LGKVDRNCELLALCGQLELDAGNNDRAQYYLEQALKLGTLPPRAAFDLALLRMNELSYQEGGRTKLPPDRVEELKVLFRMAHEQKPPLFHVYELWTAVCASTGVVTQEDLKALEFGAQHFPQRKKLVLAASYFCKAMGRPHAALALCDRALAEAHDESPERSALLKMQAELRVKCRSGP
jgi:tetratricopeptide (TPR) repeat protein